MRQQDTLYATGFEDAKRREGCQFGHAIGLPRVGTIHRISADRLRCTDRTGQHASTHRVRTKPAGDTDGSYIAANRTTHGHLALECSVVPSLSTDHVSDVVEDILLQKIPCYMLVIAPP